MDHADILFDAAVAMRLADLEVRAEIPGDTAFLTGLFLATSPLAGMLPGPVLAQQAQAQQASYRADFPQAMSRIATRGEVDIGRILIDWSGTGSCTCVDIAVLPQAQCGGIGTALLEAWIATADALDRPCTLQVAVGNPAQRIYTRLGFIPNPAADPFGPVIELTRPNGVLRA